MDKVNVDALIIVEGKTDIAFLSSFINSEFYSVNGSAINDKDISYIKKASKSKKIIVLTDPDYPGKRIRYIINSNVENCYNAFVRKEFSIKNHKVGVAESTKNEVLRAIENCVSFGSKENKIDSNLKYEDMYELGFTGRKDSSKLRKKVCDYYFIEYCNSKQFYKRLSSLGVEKEDLIEVLKNA